MKLMDRDLAERLGHETVQSIRAGGYAAPSGKWVDLREAVAAARQGTIEYPPETAVAPPATNEHVTRFSVENGTVLAVGRRLTANGPFAALNFASAAHPGGGFLAGARAQEESIARSSALCHCLEGREMYAHHRVRRDAMYTDYVIYSPDVPVFRDDEGQLLDRPWPLSIITCPAVNANGLLYAAHRTAEIRARMRGRTARVLSVAAHHQHRRLILGAWGCGAFGLDPEMMAAIFKDALTGSHRGVFEVIVFAITDWSADHRFIGPFERAFARL